MAKKTSESLLQEVVSQLRTLNRVSVRDQLREAEANKRAEKLMAQGEVQEEQQSFIIDGATDFQRRFLAGQAKTFLDRKTQVKEFALQEHQETLIKHSEHIVEYLHMLASHGSKPGSLYVHDLSVEKGIGEVLKQEIMSIDEFTKLGDTVGDELSKAAHIARGDLGYLSAPGRLNVNEDAFIKLADRLLKARSGESDEDDFDVGEELRDSARRGNLEDFMQSSKVKLAKDLLVERILNDFEDNEGLLSATVVNADDPIGSAYNKDGSGGQRFLIPAGTEIFHPGGMADTNEVVLKGFDFAEVEVDKGSLVVHSATLLDYFKERDDELDRQRNTDLRLAEERRREMIRNAGAGGIGGGLGGFGDGEDGGGGGLLSWLGDLDAKSMAIGSGLTLGGTALLFIKKIWRGIKSFGTALKLSFAAMGEFMFGRWFKTAAGSGYKKLGANPRNWAKAAVLMAATGFMASWAGFFDEDAKGDGEGWNYEVDTVESLANKSSLGEKVMLGVNSVLGVQASNWAFKSLMPKTHQAAKLTIKLAIIKAYEGLKISTFGHWVLKAFKAARWWTVGAAAAAGIGIGGLTAAAIVAVIGAGYVGWKLWQIGEAEKEYAKLISNEEMEGIIAEDMTSEAFAGMNNELPGKLFSGIIAPGSASAFEKKRAVAELFKNIWASKGSTETKLKLQQALFNKLANVSSMGEGFVDWKISDLNAILLENQMKTMQPTNLKKLNIENSPGYKLFMEKQMSSGMEGIDAAAAAAANIIGNIDQSDKRIINTETHYYIQMPTGGWMAGLGHHIAGVA